MAQLILAAFFLCLLLVPAAIVLHSKSNESSHPR